MAELPRLVLFVEGEGDGGAVPILVDRLLQPLDVLSFLRLDWVPFVVGELGGLLKENGKKWTRFLEAAARTKKPLGGVLLLLDGDVGQVRFGEGQAEPFCAGKAAIYLAQRAREVGAGRMFSVACTFARQEYESWLIAGVNTLAGMALPDGRPGVKAGTVRPEGDLEATIRGAKEWLGKNMPGGYKETTDQEPLTRMLVNTSDLLALRELRSFRRLERAVRELTIAIRSGEHVVTPLERVRTT